MLINRDVQRKRVVIERLSRRESKKWKKHIFRMRRNKVHVRADPHGEGEGNGNMYRDLHTRRHICERVVDV